MFTEEYAARTPGLSATTRSPQRGSRTDEVLVRYAEVFASDLLPDGVLDVAKDSVLAESIIARDEDSFRERRFLTEQVRGRDEAEAFARNSFLQFFAQDQRLVDFGTSLFREVLVPNLSYQAAATEAAYAEAEGDISGLRGQVSKGVVIVRRGDAITSEIKAQLESLGIESAERAGDATRSRDDAEARAQEALEAARAGDFSAVAAAMSPTHSGSNASTATSRRVPRAPRASFLHSSLRACGSSSANAPPVRSTQHVSLEPARAPQKTHAALPHVTPSA